MKYKITLNEEDYVRLRIFHFYHSTLGKRQLHSARTIAFKVSAIILLLLLIMDVQLDSIVIFTITWGIISVAFYFYAPKRLERNIRRQVGMMKQDGKLPFIGDTEIEFLESMIVQRNEHGESHVNYSDVERIYIEQEYLYIYSNAVQAAVIPYRCLGEDKKQVIKFVMGNMKDKLRK
ncbi:MAG: YcxB family protein [Lachnospiraceae bacterium]|nr:YcxB family protein [Lachnospiraceae bacterium]